MRKRIIACALFFALLFCMAGCSSSQSSQNGATGNNQTTSTSAPAQPTSISTTTPPSTAPAPSNSIVGYWEAPLPMSASNEYCYWEFFSDGKFQTNFNPEYRMTGTYSIGTRNNILLEVNVPAGLSFDDADEPLEFFYYIKDDNMFFMFYEYFGYSFLDESGNLDINSAVTALNTELAQIGLEIPTQDIQTFDDFMDHFINYMNLAFSVAEGTENDVYLEGEDAVFYIRKV